MQYAEIFAAFPQDLRLPLARLVDTLREELGVGRADFEELKVIVRDLAEAQKRTEERIDELAQAQQRTEAQVRELAQAQQRTEAQVRELAQAQQRTEAQVRELAQAQQRTEAQVRELAQAQQRTEEQVRELAQAQQRTEEQVRELAQAQQRTEERVGELAQAQQRTEEQVRELAQAQQRTENEQVLFRRTFTAQVGGLGARWGLQTEEAFRQGMRTILQEIGFTTEQFLDYDAAGEVFGHPDQIELDVIVKNGKVMVLEVKSSLDRGNTHLFDRKIGFYERKTGRRVDRKLIVTPYADARAREVAMRLGVEICTDVTTLS
jgi:hypothetical protein